MYIIYNRGTNMKLVERLVIFSILMETHNGIIEKSPEYILEKYTSALSLNDPKALLDIANREKFQLWLETWGNTK